MSNVYHNVVKIKKENPIESMKTLIKLINAVSKITGHKANIQKSIVFLYSNK